MGYLWGKIASLLEHHEFFCAPIYVLLAITVVTSTLSPFLQNLSTHGKTRLSINGTVAPRIPSSSTGCISTSSLFPRIHRFILTDDMFILSKRRFSDFYRVGLLFHITVIIVTSRSPLFPSLSSRNEIDMDFITTIITELKWTTRSPVASLLLLTHLLRRCYECRYVHVWNDNIQEEATTTTPPKTKSSKSVEYTGVWNRIQNRRYGKRRMKTRRGSNMHVAGYLLGILHYVLLPFVFILPEYPEESTSHYCPMIVSPFGNSDGWQGKTGGWLIGRDPFRIMDIVASFDIDSTWLWNWCRTFVVPWPGAAEACWLILGISLNILGQREQYKHHKILAKCRSQEKYRSIVLTRDVNGRKVDQSDTNMKAIDGEELEYKRYSIPHGRWFEDVSCPQYFAEVLIYVSFFILLQHCTDSDDYCANTNINTSMTRNQTPINYQSNIELLKSSCQYLRQRKELALLVWVVLNLAISAKSNHQWYLNHFKLEYPRERKILIPFVW